MFCYENLEKARKSMGVTKRHLADLLNRSPQIVIDWKNGKSAPSEEQLNIVARALHVTPAYLRGEEDEHGLTPKDWAAMGVGYSGYRMNKGMSIDQVARIANVSPNAIKEFEESGAPLSVGTLMVMCGALRGASIYDVFYGYANNLMGEHMKGGANAENGTESMLQTLRDEDRALLEVARGMTPEQVKMMTNFAKSMKGENNG